jgi:hypothetical protein
LIYSDAEGSGGWGALRASAPQLWFSGALPKWISAHLKRRVTQILAYELLALVVAVFSLARVPGASVVVFCDNSAVVAAVSAGTSSARDLRLIVEGFWEIAARHDLSIHVLYVPTAVNPADAPSRGRQPGLGMSAEHFDRPIELFAKIVLQIDLNLIRQDQLGLAGFAIEVCSKPARLGRITAQESQDLAAQGFRTPNDIVEEIEGELIVRQARFPALDDLGPEGPLAKRPLQEEVLEGLELAESDFRSLLVTIGHGDLGHDPLNRVPKQDQSLDLWKPGDDSVNLGVLDTAIGRSDVA